MARAPHIPKLRWSIGILLGVGVLINYFDRINLSVAAPQLQQHFGLSNRQMGWLFSSFFWSYPLLQIPIGMVLDRFGVRLVSRVSTLLWSVASAASAFAGGFCSIPCSPPLLRAAQPARLPGTPQSNRSS